MAVIDYLRINEPETLQSAEKVRWFLRKNYPGLDHKTAETIVRYQRKYKNSPTEFEKKYNNSIMVFK